VKSKTVARAAMKGLAVAALLAAAMPIAARAETPVCDTPLDIIRLANPLTHFGQKLAAGAPITIVAIGSSSTAGAGASSPAKSYPSQLAVELQNRYPNQSITVINRGVNGEEVADMVKRFDQGVVAAKPDLVLWQLGTNSLIRDHMFSDRGDAIRQGIEKIRAAHADVVLIDPQFVPKVLVKPQAQHMVNFLAVTAKEADVDLFRRFDVMRHWREVDRLPFDAFVSPDGLHMNDWSYGCIAKGLSMAIAEAAERPVMSASIMSLVP
jgi:acyl-CoA thioesterase I